MKKAKEELSRIDELLNDLSSATDTATESLRVIREEVLEMRERVKHVNERLDALAERNPTLREPL